MSIGNRRVLATRIPAVVALLGIVLLATPAGVSAAICADFASQSEAQNYFDSRGGSSTNNVDTLDEDNDGIPCEHLPGGSTGEEGFLARMWLPLVVGGAVLIGGGVAVYLLRSRTKTSPPFQAESASISLVAAQLEPLGPWPETSPARRLEFEAMGQAGEAAYLASPEWQEKEAWKSASTGGRCELCDSTDPLTLHHRRREQLYQEQPDDVIILCSGCAATTT